MWIYLDEFLAHVKFYVSGTDVQNPRPFKLRPGAVYLSISPINSFSEIC